VAQGEGTTEQSKDVEHKRLKDAENEPHSEMADVHTAVKTPNGDRNTNSQEGPETIPSTPSSPSDQNGDSPTKIRTRRIYEGQAVKMTPFFGSQARFCDGNSSFPHPPPSVFEIPYPPYIFTERDDRVKPVKRNLESFSSEGDILFPDTYIAAALVGEAKEREKEANWRVSSSRLTTLYKN